MSHPTLKARATAWVLLLKAQEATGETDEQFAYWLITVAESIAPALFEDADDAEPEDDVPGVLQ